MSAISPSLAAKTNEGDILVVFYSHGLYSGEIQLKPPRLPPPGTCNKSYPGGRWSFQAYRPSCGGVFKIPSDYFCNVNVKE